MQYIKVINKHANTEKKNLRVFMTLFMPCSILFFAKNVWVIVWKQKLVITASKILQTFLKCASVKSHALVFISFMPQRRSFPRSPWKSSGNSIKRQESRAETSQITFERLLQFLTKPQLSIWSGLKAFV